MHWLDLLIVAVLAWSTFTAFQTGLIREVAAIIALVLGAVLAGRFYHELAADIEFLISNPTTRQFVAFAAIFGGVYIAGQVLAMLLKGAATLLLLGPLDHLGGAAFGLVKGVLLVEVVLLGLRAFPVSTGVTRALDQSRLAPIFLERAPVAERLLPHEFRDVIAGGVPVALPAVPTATPRP